MSSKAWEMSVKRKTIVAERTLLVEAFSVWLAYSKEAMEAFKNRSENESDDDFYNPSLVERWMKADGVKTEVTARRIWTSFIDSDVECRKWLDLGEDAFKKLVDDWDKTRLNPYDHPDELVDAVVPDDCKKGSLPYWLFKRGFKRPLNMVYSGASLEYADMKN